MRMDAIAAALPADVLDRMGRAPIWRGAGLPSAGSAGMSSAGLFGRIREACASLAPDERRLLEAILLKWGADAVPEERLLDEAAAFGLSGLETKLSLRSLLRSGVLYAVRRTFGDSLIFLPSDLFPYWLHAALPPRLTPLSAADGARVWTEGEFRPSFAVQLACMLAELLQQDLSFTARGCLHRRTALKAAGRLALAADDLKDVQLSTAHPEVYPIPLAVGLDAAAALGLLRVDEDRLACGEGALRRWLALPARTRESGLIRIVSERLAAACRPVMHVSALLAGLPAGVWFRAAELADRLGSAARRGLPRTEGAEGDGAPDAAAAWLKALRGFGWLELGEAPDGATVFRWLYAPWEDGTDAGYEPVRLLPTGEVVVPPGADLRVRWELEACAELESSDRMTVYRLTADSISRAAANGRTAGSVLGMLESGSGERPPGETAAAVTGWFEKASKVTLRETLLLTCADAATADRLADDPALAPYLAERLGGRHYAVAAASAAELKKQLVRAGYPALTGPPASAGNGARTRLPYACAEDEAEAGDREMTALPECGKPGLPARPAGFVNGCEPLSRLPLDDGACRADDSELLAALAGLPAAWSSAIRPYHHSTKREMLEQAIRLGIPVVLETGGEPSVYVPIRVSGPAGGWQVELRERGTGGRCAMTPDMWTGMMLQKPGSAGK